MVQPARVVWLLKPVLPAASKPETAPAMVMSATATPAVT